ncbi:Gmad2 immunoglobulin-like domain-containing protein [Virgibacillus sp. C22-A2]|uniref:Gmad2 immunoglobulin-like domain-containing protein n=1 Tax=Virgibacillus tibetensis TaxID=3042313 RepID=A0ABU6KIC8_9BACI|nr:Gmad2 immunoglobulin-like domain-containing protein [Virgibacillus sp. C22-A2]
MMKKIMTFKLIILFGTLVILTACTNNTTEPDADEVNRTNEEKETTQPNFQEEDLEQEPEQDDKQEEQNNDEKVTEGKYRTHQIVLFFSDNDLLGNYRIEKEINADVDEHLAKVALEAWIKGPEHEELTGLINPEVSIEYVEDIDGIAHVSFSKEIQISNLGSSGELMLVEQIAMIMQQFGFEQTQLLVEGKVVESLLDHLYTADPIVANNPESYPWIQEKEYREIVLQNDAFQIFQPAPNTKVKDRVVVSGLAKVYEGTILYEFEDGHFILDEGFTTATVGAPEWGEFEIIIEFDEVANYSGRVILFEESAKDGSRINELQIPIQVIR